MQMSCLFNLQVMEDRKADALLLLTSQEEELEGGDIENPFRTRVFGEVRWLLMSMEGLINGWKLQETQFASADGGSSKTAPHAPSGQAPRLCGPLSRPGEMTVGG